jgi:hypothetical protein
MRSRAISESDRYHDQSRRIRVTAFTFKVAFFVVVTGEAFAYLNMAYIPTSQCPNCGEKYGQNLFNPGRSGRDFGNDLAKIRAEACASCEKKTVIFQHVSESAVARRSGKIFGPI